MRTSAPSPFATELPRISKCRPSVVCWRWLTMWIINKYHVKLTELFHLSKLFKLFQILDAVRVDYMSNMQKLQWSQECCAKKNPFWSQCTSIESTIKKPICSPYNSTWLLSWCAFFPCHPWPWCSSSGPAGSLQSLPKASQLCPSNPRGFRCHGRLGEECFPPKKWLVDLSFVPFLAKQSSEPTVHQSLTRSNLFNLASEILIRPSLHSLRILWNQGSNKAMMVWSVISTWLISSTSSHEKMAASHGT